MQRSKNKYTEIVDRLLIRCILIPMDSKHTYRVELRREIGSDCGRHGTREHAKKRIRRLVKMSNGRLTEKDFKIVEEPK
jgi:hypothetical protein